MMSAMLKASLQNYTGVMSACVVLVCFAALFGGLAFFIFRKNLKESFDRASKLPLED